MPLPSPQESLKSRGSEMLFSAFSTISFDLDSVKNEVFLVLMQYARGFVDLIYILALVH